MTSYRHEVPYCCEVTVAKFKEMEEIIRIQAIISVAHESQKGIVIGHKGAALKKVGTRARKRMEDFFKKQIYLETKVKVRKGWTNSALHMRNLGYD